MKKNLLFLFLTWLLVLAGCQTPASSREDLIMLLTEDLALPDETAADLYFPTEYALNHEVLELSWLSDDETTIAPDGTVNRGFVQKSTSIHVVIVINGETITKPMGEVAVTAWTDEEIAAELASELSFPLIATQPLTFPDTLLLFGETAELSWFSSDPSVIGNDGAIHPKDISQSTDLTVAITVGERSILLPFMTIFVNPLNKQAIIDAAIAEISLPDSTDSDLDLPTKIGDVIVQWSSDQPNILSDDGEWSYSETDALVTMTAIFAFQGLIVERDFPITVLTYTNAERLQAALSQIAFEETVGENLNLQTMFDYGVTGVWISDLPEVISNTGTVWLDDVAHAVTLSLTLKSGDDILEQEYTVVTKTISGDETYFPTHMLVYRTSDFKSEGFDNLIVSNGKIVLAPDALLGSYQSEAFRTNPFTKLVGSWAATSSADATCELKIRVRVNGVWSSYLSYGIWGLGRQNAMTVPQSAGIASMSEDELTIANSQTADAFQFLITLRRDSALSLSPKLTLVGISLLIPGYVYPVDTALLPDFVDWNVPELYQHDVPTIGGSICSITSSTMLLLFKGHSFADSLPHREVAPLFYDYGNKIYGNWVYNIVGMGAYGESSYVKRIYSWDELKHHLAIVGPVAVSIKGNTGLYTTSGHLIVVRGYEVIGNQTWVICNDPNVASVYYKYDLQVFLGFTRNVIYVLE
ncbi:MAG TPA: hypothetical protein DD618_02790 [Acholeplasmatales bacterium]|nr:hypothetical protein [Acholeplasmatales bacterium]